MAIQLNEWMSPRSKIVVNEDNSADYIHPRHLTTAHYYVQIISAGGNLNSTTTRADVRMKVSHQASGFHV